MTKLELSYLAGLFDGEGLAGVYIISRKKSITRKPYKTAAPLLQLRMTDKDPVIAFSKLGGWFGSSKAAPGGKGPIWESRLSHRVALKAAKMLLPFCKNKSKHLQLNKIITHYTNWKSPIKGEKRF